MTTSIESISGSQSALQVGGVRSLVFDQTGIVTGVDTGHRDITASVASSALTVTLAPTTIRFRNPTLTIGSFTQRAVASALTIVAPSGASFGAVNGVLARLVVFAIDATALGGSVELALANVSGGVPLDESGLISTTAISAGATSATVIYSAIARSNVPYRVVGFVDLTEATAGVYATAPSTVQGLGGAVLSALASFGFGQKWTDVVGSRAIGTTYYNTTGKPISVAVASNVNGALLTPTVGGQAFPGQNIYSQGWVTFIVPPGQAYSMASTQPLSSWIELR